MIRVETLGTPACYRDDVALPELPAQKTRFALLVYLAIERNVSRDEAAALFWAESGEERARHTLSQMLYELKRLLGDSWLETQSGRLVVTEALVADAGAMSTLCQKRQFSEAADLYQGPFLNGFFLANCKGFETWVDRQRLQYERMHRKACREAVNDLIEKKNVQGAIEVARKWVALDPLEDEANHRLIDLLAASGKRSEALREYDVYERRIREELQVEPLEETRQLVASLRTDKGAAIPASTLTAGAVQTQRLSVSAAPRQRSRLKIAAATGAVLPLVGVFAWFSTKSPPGDRDKRYERLDTTRIAIIPFEYKRNAKAALDEDARLQDAFDRWRGITTVDVGEVRQAITAHGGVSGPDDALEVARAVKAGRYVKGEVSLLGDSVRVHVALRDARRRNNVIYELTQRVPASLAGIDSAFAYLADQLLFEGLPGREFEDGPAGTSSWYARKHFLNGRQAVREWRLERADSLFGFARVLDDRYARASLWLGQVRAWSGADQSRWRFAVEGALVDSVHLSAWERAQAHALVDLSFRRFPAACVKFRELTTTRAGDFAGWYSLATCLKADHAVVDDPASPSSKSFRASEQEALSAYQKAFLINPKSLRAFSANSYLPARELFQGRSNLLREGVGVGSDTTQYWAYPQQLGDTIGYIPFAVVGALKRRSFNDATAIRKGRLLEAQMFRDVAAAWRSTDAKDAASAEAMAIALEMLGDSRAIDTLHLARHLATQPEEKLRLAAYETTVLFKFAFPDDAKLLKGLVTLCDSVLRAGEKTKVVDPQTFASVALLRGRLRTAADFAAKAASLSAEHLPSSVNGTAERLLIYSAVDAPRDSILAMQGRLFSFARGANADARDDLRTRWLLRSVILTHPRANPAVAAFVPSDYYVLKAQLEERRDRLHSRAILLEQSREWADVPPQDRTFDIVLPEAGILLRTGDLPRATEWLDPALRTLVMRAPASFSDPIQVGSALRAAWLRAEMAYASRDASTAARWARALLTLWNKPDPELEPITARLQRLSHPASH